MIQKFQPKSLNQEKEGKMSLYREENLIDLPRLRRERVEKANMRSKKGAIKLAVFLSMVFLLVASAQTAFCKPPYKVGLLDSFSGFMAFMGDSMNRGFQLAVDEINGSGGIHGHKIDVVSYSDESDVSKGILALKKLIETDKVLVIAGVTHSGVAIASAPIAEKSRVPIIFGNSSRWSVAKPNKWILPGDPAEVFDFTFKVRVDSQTHLQTMYDFAKKIGIEKLAWMSAGTAYGKSAKEIFLATYKGLGFEAAAVEEYGPNDSDMTPQITRIKASDFDAIFIYSAEPAGALAYKQARELGITKPIIADSPMVSTSIMDTLGKYLVGLYVCVHASDIPDLSVLPQSLKPMAPVIAKVRKGALEKYRVRADCWTAQGFDRAGLMIDALKRAASDPTNLKASREKIRDALATTKGFVGAYVLGDMSRYHEAPVPVTMIKITEGQKFELAK
jgi:branched-chain amino acid transport system substrate-binding protein